VKIRLSLATITVVTILSSLLAGYSVWVAADARQNTNSDARVAFRRTYTNPIFGYSVSIPDNLIGLGAVPQAPNHGITIALNDDADSYIFVDAEYNASDYTSPVQEADDNVAYRKELGAFKIKVKREITTLCNLAAIRQTLAYHDEAGSAGVDEAVFALLTREKYTGITYEVSLRTTPKNFENARPLYLRVLRSFKCMSPKG